MRSAGYASSGDERGLGSDEAILTSFWIDIEVYRCRSPARPATRSVYYDRAAGGYYLDHERAADGAG
jgi:hypothetical protein